MNFSEKISVEEVFKVQQNGERIFMVGFRKDLAINDLGVTLSGRAFRSNLFARSSQKGFPLQSLTQRQAYGKK